MAKEYKTALTELNKYETQYGADKKLDLYKGQMLQKNGKNEEALEYLEKSLSDEHTMIGLNAKADALYKLGRYDEALHDFNQCIQYEKQAGDDLELITNFNYKAAFCCVKLGDNQEAIKLDKVSGNIWKFDLPETIYGDSDKFFLLKGSATGWDPKTNDLAITNNNDFFNTTSMTWSKYSG